MERIFRGTWVVWFIIVAILAFPFLLAAEIEDFVNDIYDDDLYYGGE